MASKEFKTGILITGDATGAQRAIKVTQEQLESLQRSARETEQSSFRLADGWQKDLKSLSGAALKWSAVTASAAVAATGALVKSAIDSADATGILASKLGITTEALSRLQYAAQLSDVSQGALESGLRKLSTTLVAAADPASKAAKALSAIGLSASQLIDLPADEQLARIGEALSRVENASAKAALSQQIFGKSGQALLPLLAEGADGIRRLGDEAERLGVVVSGATAASAMEFNDNLDRLKLSAQGLGMSIAQEVLPSLQGFTTQLTELAQRKETAEGIATFIGGIGTALVTTANIIATTSNVWRYLGEEIAAAMNGPAIGDLPRIQAAIDAAKNGIAYLEGKQKALSGGLQTRSFSEEDTARLQAYRAELARYTQMLDVSEQLERDRQRAIADTARAQEIANSIAEIDLNTLPKKRVALGQVNRALEESARLEAERQKRTASVIENLRFEVAQIGRNNREQAVANALRSAGADATSDQGREISRLTLLLADHDEAMRRNKDALDEMDRGMADLEHGMTKVEERADPWADALKGAVERIDSSFVDMWKNIGSGFDSFADSLKDAFQQLLAELANMAITRPILMRIGAAFGLGGGSSGALASAGGASSMFSGIGSLFGGAKSFLGGFKSGGLSGGIDALAGAGSLSGNWLGNALTDFRFALGDVSRSLGLDGLAGRFDAAGLKINTFGQSVVDLGANLGAGMAGSFAGNKVGQALFGERKTTGAGGTIGGVIGSAWGPMGTAIGSFLGSLAENAVAKIFGAGDLVKWGKLGITTGKDIPTDGSALQTVTAASGLTLSAVAKRTDAEAAKQLLESFSAIDSALTAAARASGVAVDFTNKTLGTTSLNVDGDGPKNSFGVGARLDKFSADAIKSSADDFARQWIAQIVDQLPQRVKALLGDTAKQTAAQIVDMFNVSTMLDKLLSIDVVAEVEKAAQKSATTLLDLYNTSTEAVMTFAHEMSGSIEQLGLLNEKLGEQKQVAAQLAAAYAEAASVVERTFGQAIESIQNDLLSSDQLYEKRRTQIADLTAQLSQTVDPQKIAELTSRIDGLAGSAWQQLDESQKKTMGEEFLSFLRNAQAIAEQQIAAGQASLTGRETALASGVDLEVMRSAAEIQSQAAQQFLDAATLFANAVSSAGAGSGTFNWSAILAALPEVNV